VLGDDLLELSLPGFVEWWRAKPQPSAAVPLHDVGDLELATHYGIASTDADDRVVHFIEKPSDPPSTLAATVAYLLPPEHVRLVGAYLDEGQSPDNAAASWAGSHVRRPSTATASTATGTTSETTRSCSKRTTGCGVSPGCRCGTSTASTDSRRFRHTSRRSVGDVLDLLLPQRCVVCGGGGRQLCSVCREELPMLEPPLCERCGAPDSMAGRAVPRMCGTPARLRDGARRGRLRRGGTQARPRVEGSAACGGSPSRRRSSSPNAYRRPRWTPSPSSRPTAPDA
jgi:hypothetical protein